MHRLLALALTLLVLLCPLHCFAGRGEADCAHGTATSCDSMADCCCDTQSEQTPAIPEHQENDGCDCICKGAVVGSDSSSTEHTLPVAWLSLDLPDAGDSLAIHRAATRLGAADHLASLNHGGRCARLALCSLLI